MTITVDSAASAAIVSPARGLHFLVDLDFASGPIYYTTAPISIVANGHTYIGTVGLVDVSPLSESENTGDEKITLGVSIVNTAMIAASLGNVEGYRGRSARLYVQFVDSTFQPAGSPVLFWSGYMEPVRITRNTSLEGPSTGRIELPLRRAGMARARNADGLRLSDAQHQSVYPGDRGYEYITTLVEQPSLWLSKKFQAI